jgi:hypothetical protein
MTIAFISVCTWLHLSWPVLTFRHEAVCPGIVPGTGSSPCVVREVITQISACLVWSHTTTANQAVARPRINLMSMGAVLVT